MRKRLGHAPFELNPIMSNSPLPSSKRWGFRTDRPRSIHACCSHDKVHLSKYVSYGNKNSKQELYFPKTLIRLQNFSFIPKRRVAVERSIQKYLKVSKVL